ncbi:DUF2790 domain-containing protein [Pseudomonas sp. B21-051]|uniref:DUF2790 domain-containing protein n=1 Tax=Pseudomonas sp. B21-051 TaxID=2895491 RepID=UPI00215F286D|nr:DUF2790 domain-containing protein [Pseudomonas sp. B21-051]UVK86149.1 DUF2790 domain-containing protein [Pseudomonas sp. B21-051]
MNIVKIAVLLALGGIGAQAFAADETAQVEAYNAAAQAGIAHVVSISEAANLCGAVPVQMTYDDSNGARHVVQYQVMGSGCSNG